MVVGLVVGTDFVVGVTRTVGLGVVSWRLVGLFVPAGLVVAAAARALVVTAGLTVVACLATLLTVVAMTFRAGVVGFCDAGLGVVSLGDAGLGVVACLATLLTVVASTF